MEVKEESRQEKLEQEESRQEEEEEQQGGEGENEEADGEDYEEDAGEEEEPPAEHHQQAGDQQLEQKEDQQPEEGTSRKDNNEQTLNPSSHSSSNSSAVPAAHPGTDKPENSPPAQAAISKPAARPPATGNPAKPMPPPHPGQPAGLFAAPASLAARHARLQAGEQLSTAAPPSSFRPSALQHSQLQPAAKALNPSVAAQGAQAQTIRRYLDSTVLPVLRLAFRDLCTERPEDPWQFLADYIIAHKPK